ncbi:MAG: TfuA-like protein [Terriglobia bacterium]
MSGTNSNCYLYAGPTLLGTPCGGIKPPRGIRLLPPAQRGDIEKLVSYSRPGVIILVDGVFHQYLAVGHAEIREAVAEGWRVWGLSSMGAIRAYEMRNVGVRGYGRVYECFFQHEDFRDDEVALLHEPEPPFRSFSEPLVHIRFWLLEMMETRLLSPSQHDQILESLKSMWFGDRTLLRVRGMILDLVPEHVDRVDAMLAQFDRFRVKSLDLADFVQKQVWKTL